MHGRRFGTLITVLGLLFAPTVIAAPRGGGSGQECAHGRLFDPKTMTSISGRISAVEEFAPMGGKGAGIHLTVESKAGTFDVHLGPAWYLESQNVHLKRGDTVDVSGSRVVFNNQPAIIAVEVRHDGNVLVLRDSQGVPRWAGWRRGPPST